MPAFSICKELKDLRSVSKFIQYFNSTEIPENFETFSPKFLDEITLKESEIDINYKLFENPSKTFKRIVTNINRGFKCFTIFIEFENQIQPKLTQTDYTSAIISFSITFNSSDFPSINFLRLIIHSPQEKVWSPYSTRNIQISNNSLKDITFERQLIETLPSPFETNCIDYKDIDFQSKNDCTNHCLISLTKKRCNQWPGEVFADKSVNDTFLKNFRQMECFGKQTEKYCNNKCQHNNCVQYLFTTEELNEFPKTESLDEIQFYVWFPLTYDHIIVFEPTFSFVQFLNHIGGVVNIWFGISVLSLEALVSTLYKTMSNNCKI